MLRYFALAALAVLAAAPARAQASAPVPRPILEQLVVLADDRENFPDTATLGRFVELTRRELNGDRRAEYFVRGTGPFCGATGNCREWVFTRGGDGAYRLLLDAAGKALVPRRTSTGGWRDLAQDGHLSAYETVREHYQFDGTRYVETASELAERDGGATRVGYRVRTPLGTPRAVALEPVGAGAPGVRLSGSYAACATPTPGRVCGTPWLLLAGVRGLSADRCVTVEVEDAGGTARPFRARCTARSGGGADVALSLGEAEWREIATAIGVRLRGPGVDAKLPDGARMGLTIFAAKVLELNGIDPYPDDAS